MTARSIGTATISFGLVSIPVKLYTTNESSNDISFNMLHDKDGARLKQQYVCTCCNEVVDRDHTVKGYEHAKGQYVSFTADEIKALDAVASHAIALEEFVPASEIDPLYVEKSYYLGPDKGAERAYRLIRDAMLETGLVGVASYAARGKQSIVALRPFREGLIVHQLRYAAEVKNWAEVPMPELPESREVELRMAKMLIDQLTVATFTSAKYTDVVQARMRKLIDQKIDGQEITMPAPTPSGQLVDLISALQLSLGQKPSTPVAAPVEPTPPTPHVPSAPTPTKPRRGGARKGA